MSAQREVIKASRISQIIVSDILIGTKKINKKVSVRYHDKPLVIQTPFLEIMSPLKKTSHPNIYQMETLFKGDTKNKIDEWYDFIENMETQITNQVIANGTHWFTSKNVNINSLVKECDPQGSRFFTRWLVILESNIFVDTDKKTFNPAMLKEKDLVKLIVEIPDLWVEGDQCGLATVVQKIMVKPYQEKVITEYVFDESESDESDDSGNNTSIISLLATEQKIKQNQPIKQKNGDQEKNVKPQSKSLPTNQNSQTERNRKLMEDVREISGKRPIHPEQVGKNASKNRVTSHFSEDEKIIFQEFHQSQDSLSSDEINEEDLDF